MRITARTFASLRELSVDRCELDLEPGATVDDAWSALRSRYPALDPQRPYARAARNGVYVSWDERIAEGDIVAFLPPVSGGAAPLTASPIDVGALEREVAGSGMGAIVTFVGRARDVADDGRHVVELEYEAYDEMAASVLDEIRSEAEARFGVACAVVHRSGVVAIGEAAVAIVTAARHRAEAYEANRFVIEAIKERLPVWKRERFEDGSEWKRSGA
jgi:MoaE-MoaD fusion protein